jgi:hypothetical protein
MAKFGKYAILDVVEHHFEKEPDWVWRIKPPNSGDELAMQKFMVNNRYEIDADGTRREFPPTYIEVAYREIAVTFAGTNIPGDDGKPILADAAKVFDVENILRQMPHEMIMEIWKAIWEAVPGWGMNPLPKTEAPTDTEAPSA